MPYLSTFDATGNVTGTFSTDIHSVIPPEAIAISDADHQLYATGLVRRNMITGLPEVIPPKPPSMEEYVAAAQHILDSVAQSRNYDGILSMCSYATSQNAPFAAEAKAGVEWRDAIWLKAYEIMSAVKAGTVPQPTIDAFIAELPAIVWP